MYENITLDESMELLNEGLLGKFKNAITNLFKSNATYIKEFSSNSNNFSVTVEGANYKNWPNGESESLEKYYLRIIASLNWNLLKESNSKDFQDLLLDFGRDAARKFKASKPINDVQNDCYPAFEGVFRKNHESITFTQRDKGMLINWVNQLESFQKGSGGQNFADEGNPYRLAMNKLLGKVNPNMDSKTLDKQVTGAYYTVVFPLILGAVRAAFDKSEIAINTIKKVVKQQQNASESSSYLYESVTLLDEISYYHGSLISNIKVLQPRIAPAFKKRRSCSFFIPIKAICISFCLWS